MSLFSSRKEPFSTDLNSTLYGYNVQTSLQGVSIALIYGQVRLPGNVLWTGDWQATPLSGSGKLFSKGSSGKGGSNGQQFDYKTAIIIGLCQGPITSLGHIWVNKIQYNINTSTETYTVPSSGVITPINALKSVSDIGTAIVRPYSVTADDYGSPGPVTLTGEQLTPLTLLMFGTPGADQYTYDPTTGVYTFSTANVGQTVQINYVWADDDSSYDGNPTTQLNFALFTGDQGQAPWGYLTSNHPDQALGYSELAYIANQLVDLGSAGVLQNYSFEVTGFFPFTAGITDANPAVIIPDFLSHPLHGAGFPSANIGDLTQMSNSCIANGIFISPLINQQKTAASYIEDWCKIANCAPVWSEGLLKFIPYGDTTVVGNGVTYVPNTTPIYDLDDDDFITKKVGQSGIKVNRPSVRDAYNTVTVEWCNRGNQYNNEPIEEKDDYSISQYGYRPAPNLQLDAIKSQDVAQQVANIALKNLVYKRNTYVFMVSAIKYCLLEPMDLITVSDFYLGLDKTPVRITNIDEDDELILTITAEEFPWGTATATLNPKQSTAPSGPGYFSKPGSVNAPIFFEATAEMTQDVLYTLLIALSGYKNWGGCNVHVSTDGGNSYTNIGTQKGSSTMGLLTAPLPSHIDPDTTDTLAVNLTESLGELTTYTQAQADKFLSLILVDQELLAYETATMTGSYLYNINYLRRGVYDTGILAHPTNAPFAVMDTGVFSWVYTQDMIGRTLFFKFTSFNEAGQLEEPIANVEAYPYFIHGPITPYPLACNDFPNTPTLSVAAGAALRSPSFGLKLSSYINPGGVAFNQLVVTTTSIPNVFSSATQPPTISLTSASTGGTIPGNQVVTVGVYVQGPDGLYTVLAQASLGLSPATNTNTVTVHVVFANPSTDVGFAVITIDPDEGWFGSGPTIPMVGSSYTFTSIGALNTPVPIADYDHLVIEARTAIKYGVWGGAVGTIVNNMDGTSTITFLNPDGSNASDWPINQFQGRIITCYANIDPTMSVPLADAIVISSGVTSVTTVNLVGIVGVGDQIACQMQATSFSSTTIGDSNILISSFGSPLPLIPHAWIGQLIKIIAGTGANTTPTVIADNTTDTFTMATPFEITPDATSVFILLNASVEYITKTGPLAIPDFVTEVTQAITVSDDWRHFFVQVFIADSNGDISLPEWSPFRLIFSNGLPPNLSTRKTILADYTVMVSDQVILCDTTAGPITVTLLSAIVMAGQILYIKKITSDGNSVTVLPAAGDNIDGNPSVVLATLNDNIELLGNGSD